jgi:glycosyltransferase involved in cell wall biosynthesis
MESKTQPDGSPRAIRPVVCLPTRNEIGCVAEMLVQIRDLGLAVFICDSGSTDGTREAASALGVSVYDREGPGKGYGIRKALQVAYEAGFTHLVLLDCDNTYPVSSIPDLLRHADTADCVMGIRPMRDISLVRRLVNYLHTGLINILFGASLKDINTGMRVLRVEKFRGILSANNFDIEAQMSSMALKRGLKLTEVPVSYHKRTGKSKIGARDFFEIIFRILRERFRRD